MSADGGICPALSDVLHQRHGIGRLDQLNIRVLLQQLVLERIVAHDRQASVLELLKALRCILAQAGDNHLGVGQVGAGKIEPGLPGRAIHQRPCYVSLAMFNLLDDCRYRGGLYKFEPQAGA